MLAQSKPTGLAVCRHLAFALARTESLANAASVCFVRTDLEADEAT
jgi:hypothetical protein